MASLLVVEDEPHIASGLCLNLEAGGDSVLVADSGEAALAIIDQQPHAIDCVILDVMLPGMDGFEVAATLRARGWFTPILMLTARGRADDVLRGFEAGADDYVPKPFDLSILSARVKALIRRRQWPRVEQQPSQTAAGDSFTFGNKTVDFEAQELRVAGHTHPLTLMETNLLRYLVQHDGQIVSRRRMLEDVWNVHEDTDTRAIDHFIARLRKYIETSTAHPRHLTTIRGVGYRFLSTPGE
jgi:DNA-binding response OmpR family regulator